MGSFDRQIVVTLINNATGAPLATIELPSTDLPESFELETTLHLGDADWSVVEAQPRTRPEYSKSGKLTLRLHLVERIDPSNILYSLPSICDRIPPIGAGGLSGSECVLAEDDWRQLELVSRLFATDADAEIASVRRIHEQERVDVGWREIHVRSRPDPPIAGSLTLEHVERAFGGSVTYRGVSYRGASSPIVSGYSFRAADGLECYGLAEDGRVRVLGVVQNVPEPPPIDSADALIEIAREFDLDLVHWCQCRRASWDNPQFRHMLLGGEL
jgi:hypothetical protein